ncbi:MAG: N-acetyltransferase [Cyanobacteriota bacterium]|nr:N-acetyltransferase [Cyanobacteriota bacterium]
MIPFRNQPSGPRLPEGYALLESPQPQPDALNRLLNLMGDSSRSPERWARVLERSLWHLAVVNQEERWVGFIRATSDLALNANLWDLSTDPADSNRSAVLLSLVHGALSRLRRELGGCSISLSAPPEAIAALQRHGFLVDPGGIRAMGLKLNRS